MKTRFAILLLLLFAWTCVGQVPAYQRQAWTTNTVAYATNGVTNSDGIIESALSYGDGIILTTNTGVVNIELADGYVDSMVPALSIVPGATAPVLATFVSANLKVYGFNSNQDDEATFTLQINHDYEEGTTIYPHVHWAPATAPSGTATNIVWGLEYTVQKIGSAFNSTTTIYATNDITGYAQWQHAIINLPTITDTNLTISSVMVGRVFRPSNSMEGATRYNADAMFLGFDVHYLGNTMGSSTPTSK